MCGYERLRLDNNTFRYNWSYNCAEQQKGASICGFYVCEAAELPKKDRNSRSRSNVRLSADRDAGGYWGGKILAEGGAAAKGPPMCCDICSMQSVHRQRGHVASYASTFVSILRT